MGDFTAKFPGDRRYAKNHMWAMEVAPGRFRFGLTAYAVRLLQDVYFLDWLIEPPAPVASRAHIGSIESKKAESDLFSPLSGKLVAINEAALADPSVINAAPYGDGWMIEIEADASADVDRALLLPDGYATHLTEAWDVAQRTIKGQANT
ncbi:MAG: glycine cleavage system protein H [Rubripirellula sp.]